MLWIHGSERGQLQEEGKGGSYSKLSSRELTQGPEGQNSYL